MLRWVQESPLPLHVDEIGEHYGRYRLHLPEAERAMARSLERSASPTDEPDMKAFSIRPTTDGSG